MSRTRIKKICSIESCERPHRSNGLCQYHYNKKRLEEKPERSKAGLRGHPLYNLWYERKQNNLLCAKWLDFRFFIWDIGSKPEGEFFLVRLNDKAPFGPDNFKWVEQLRRKLNETNSEWWARKLEARKQNNPNLYSDRNLKRKFGLTREWYEQKLKDQNYKCAICEKEETTFDSRANVKRRLSVDHCHESGKIRDLLCWRCNATLGKLDEDLELIKKIENYIVKHRQVAND